MYMSRTLLVALLCRHLVALRDQKAESPDEQWDDDGTSSVLGVEDKAESLDEQLDDGGISSVLGVEDHDHEHVDEDDGPFDEKHLDDGVALLDQGVDADAEEAGRSGPPPWHRGPPMGPGRFHPPPHHRPPPKFHPPPHHRPPPHLVGPGPFHPPPHHHRPPPLVPGVGAIVGAAVHGTNKLLGGPHFPGRGAIVGALVHGTIVGAVAATLAKPGKPPSPAMIRMQIVVPQGAGEGQMLTVQTPDGRQFQVAVPKGVSAGQTMQIDVPAA